MLLPAGEHICINDVSQRGQRRLYVISDQPINSGKYTQGLGEVVFMFPFVRQTREGQRTYHLWVMWQDQPEAHTDLITTDLNWREFERLNWPAVPAKTNPQSRPTGLPVSRPGKPANRHGRGIAPPPEQKGFDHV